MKTKADFQNVLNSAAKIADQFGKTTNVSLFSHAGDQSGPVFHDASGHATQFTQHELSNLQVNWGANSTASFYGCSTANNFAQNFADAQRVRSFGFLGGVDFSGRPDSVSEWYLFNGQFDRYMVDKGEQAVKGPRMRRWNAVLTVVVALVALWFSLTLRSEPLRAVAVAYRCWLDNLRMGTRPKKSAIAARGCSCSERVS